MFIVTRTLLRSGLSENPRGLACEQMELFVFKENRLTSCDGLSPKQKAR